MNYNLGNRKMIQHNVHYYYYLCQRRSTTRRQQQQRFRRCRLFRQQQQQQPPLLLILMMFALLLFVLSSFIYYLFLLQSHNTTTIISSSSSSSPITGGDEWETISIQPTVVVVGQQQHNEQQQQHDDDDISSSSLNQTNKNNHQYNNNNNNKRKSRWVKTHHHYHRSSSSNNNNNNNNTTTTTSSTTIISKNKNSNNNNNIIHVGKDDIIMGKGNSHDAAIVIDKYKLIFFTIQKCGGTVWKQLFRRIQGYDNWRTGKTWGRKLGVRQLNGMSIEEATKIMNDPNWIKAMMVRDPKERLVSSYLDKAIQTDYFYDHCCRSKSKSYVKICPKITNKDEYISFDTFVAVTEYCHDKHWMPQSTKMEIKYIQLIDFIGHIETAYDDAKELLESIGNDAWEKYGMLGWGKYGNESIFQSTSYVEHKTSTSNYESKSRLAKYYTPELEKIVEERYKNDYNIKQFDLQLTKIEY